jgi:phosphate-selective porin
MITPRTGLRSLTTLLVSLVALLCAGIAVADDTKAAAPSPLAGWDKKFSLQSADGRYKLNLGGRLQMYYEYDRPDPNTNEVQYGTSFASKPAIEDTSQFRIRRGRFVMDGNVFQKALQYEVQLELAGSSTFLKRAYLNWKQNDALQFRVGRFKAPFGRQQLASIFKQEFTDRSLVTNTFTKGDDDGAMVWGMPRNGHYEYYFGVFNGDGTNANTQQDSHNQWFGRAVWSPTGMFAYSESALGMPAKPQWSLGVNGSLNGGWLYEVNGKNGMQPPMQTCTTAGCLVDQGDNSSISFLGVDSSAKWKGLFWEGEYFVRRADPRQPNLRNVTAKGWYQQVGFFVQPNKHEIGFRYGILDPSNNTINDRTKERGVFYNYYMLGHDYKIQTEYSEFLTETSTATPRMIQLEERRVRVQFVVSF